MKKLMLYLSLFLIGSCASEGLKEQEVKDFVINHVENQVNYDEAVQGFLEGISDDAVIWSNPVWKNIPKKFEKEGTKDEAFYDSYLKVLEKWVLLNIVPYVHHAPTDWMRTVSQNVLEQPLSESDQSCAIYTILHIVSIVCEVR